MKKIINDPKQYLSEMLEGIYIAHQDQIAYVNDDPQCLVTRTKKAGKVGIATGGGSGHLPLFLGYVGDGMLDGCSVGDVFQSPSAEQMHAITKEIDSGAGVLYIYGNYNGDIFNFDMAAQNRNKSYHCFGNLISFGYSHFCNSSCGKDFGSFPCNTVNAL